MISFKDRAFCVSSEECAADCYRRLTPDLIAEAKRWWGGPNAPIAFSDMKGGPYCVGFVPKTNIPPKEPTP